LQTLADLAWCHSKQDPPPGSLTVDQAEYLLTILAELDDMEQEAHELRVGLSRALHRPLDAPVPEHRATLPDVP